MNYEGIISKVTDEKTLRRKVIMKIFTNMGFSGVLENHGPYEFGKDVVFYKQNGNERKYMAVVAKKGDVDGKAINDIVRQVNQCLSIPYPSSNDGNVEIQEVYVITDGFYNGSTGVTLSGMKDLYNKFGYTINIWNGDDLKKAWENYHSIGVNGPVFYETYEDNVVRLRLSKQSEKSKNLIQILHFDDDKVVEALWMDEEKTKLEEIRIYNISGEKIDKFDLIKSFMEDPEEVDEEEDRVK
ncbi:hypothetical protein CN270_10830 [Priestia megaterium]|uniref:hypothetical protein n=1 Tax=Priestia megaterium TaxID=1404 RepID=UPI000BF59687|nr:hypothetical protein [Priestia megaterium]PFE34187.1 hypothetical protein CN270_10830 [Priestia megaterium]